VKDETTEPQEMWLESRMVRMGRVVFAADVDAGDSPTDMAIIGVGSFDSVRSDILHWWPRTRHLLCGFGLEADTPEVLQAVADAFPAGFSVAHGLWWVER
jgi:hypothetical protein